MKLPTIDELHARLQSIVDGSDGRSMTDAEVADYEATERDLQDLQRTESIRARQTAYNTPVGPSMAPVGIVAPARVDNGLDLAFDAYLRTGQPNADITGLAVRNDLGVGTGAGGGYTVPPGFRQRLVEVQKSFGGLAPYTDSFDTGDGAPVEYPSMDDTSNSGAIVAENTAPTTGADLVFGSLTLGAYDYTSAGASGNPLRISWNLLQDSAFDVSGLVARALGIRIARAMAPHWVTGTGVAQPKGLMASSLTSDRDLDTPDTPDYQDLAEFMDLLDDAYVPNARWLMRKSTWTKLRLIVDTAGRPIIQDSTSGISEMPARRLLGHDVIIDEAVPVLSSAGTTFCMAFGDFREAYVRRMVSNLAVVVNPWTRANYRQTEFLAWQRADGTIQNRSAYKILRNNT